MKMSNQEYSVKPILIGNNIRIKIRQALDKQIVENMANHIYNHSKENVHFKTKNSKYEYHFIEDINVQIRITFNLTDNTNIINFRDMIPYLMYTYLSGMHILEKALSPKELYDLDNGIISKLYLADIMVYDKTVTIII